MAILSNADKEKIKRAIPKTSNKIIDATVCRLYIAYPDTTKWTYTGLVGAIALVDDLVGHTFFLKLVDIIASRGVLWDHELYVDFGYHQDRTFFHTFETEECLMGLLFEDTLDAAHFFKRVISKQKYASKQTANNKNAVALKDRMAPQTFKVGSRGEYVDANTGQRSRRAKGILYYDDQPPVEWRLLYSELAAAGISEDMIAENREFIKDYIAKQGGPLVGLEPPIPRRYAQSTQISSVTTTYSPAVPKKMKKAPPPPPNSNGPPQVDARYCLSNEYSQHSFDSSRSPSPAPSTVPSAPPLYSSRDSANIDANDVQTQSTEISSNRFRLPPVNAPIPPVLHSTVMPSIQNTPVSSSYSNQQNQQNQQNGAFQHKQAAPLSNADVPPPLPPQNARAGPPPPPRAGLRPGMPPPLRTNTAVSSEIGTAPPTPPPRGDRAALPPTPSRAQAPFQTQLSQAPPLAPPPQAVQNVLHTGELLHAQEHASGAPSTSSPVMPSASNFQAPPPPLRTQPTALTPAPPPIPPSQQSLPQMTQQTPQTSPSVPGTGAPPPPPPPLDMGFGSSAPALPAGDSSRDALFASIRGSGIGILKKTDKSQLEKPNVLLNEARGEAPPLNTGAIIAGQPETLADALASALNKRKEKVTVSDDEEDNDDW